MAYDGDGEYLPGEWCTFCKVSVKCRARAEEKMKLARLEFKMPPLLTDAEIEEVLDVLPDLTKWANEITAYATEAAIHHGKEWNGFKVVATPIIIKACGNAEGFFNMLTEDWCKFHAITFCGGNINALYTPGIAIEQPDVSELLKYDGARTIKMRPWSAYTRTTQFQIENEKVDRYLKTKTGVRQSTKQGYVTVQRLLAKETFGKKTIRSVKTSDAKLFLIKLQQEDGKSYSSIHTIRGVLRPAFQMAVDDDILVKNPFGFQLAGVLVNDAVTREVIYKDQMRKFLKFVHDDVAYCK